MKAIEKVKTLDPAVKISDGINWTWAEGLSDHTANVFVLWLDQHGYEHRGIYPDRNNPDLFDVRFR